MLVVLDMHVCETFQFYRSIDKVILKNTSYIKRENQLKFSILNQRKKAHNDCTVWKKSSCSTYQ